MVINQTKGNIKDNFIRCYQRIVRKYHTTNCLKVFGSSLTHWVKWTYRELKSVLGLLLIWFMVHPVGYISSFGNTSCSCYNPLDIFQRVTKSLKVHFSSPNELQSVITSTLVNIGPSSSQSGDKVTEICPSLSKS